MYKTIIVDGPYIAHRSYDAPYKLTTPDGLDATLIHGFIRSLNARRKECNPERIIIAWESPGTPSWRKKLYPLYKQTRGRLNNNFISSQTDLQILLHLFGVKQYFSPTNEADDVIATLVKRHNKSDTLIYSNDKDLTQLIGDNCHMHNGKEIMTSEKVKNKFGVYPKDIPRYLAIVGDNSDNIKGIDGIGPKKAMQYIYGDENLDRYKNKVTLNEKLTTLNSNCKLEELKPDTTHTIKSLLDKYKLNSIKEKIREYELLGEKND